MSEKTARAQRKRLLGWRCFLCDVLAVAAADSPDVCHSCDPPHLLGWHSYRRREGAPHPVERAIAWWDATFGPRVGVLWMCPQCWPVALALRPVVAEMVPPWEQPA